ncbi:mobilization protein [Campylobacter aviculae]|uniref:Mobilization protein n=1 Tax=Campylobacter aviculae TaxID=2510190 RepID=A0A4U7BL30_9BACT|nr:mobilization protein [Campylobacter aviculae]
MYRITIKSLQKSKLFDTKTLKMIEMMLSTYKNIFSVGKENKKITEIVKLAIEKMFKNDFLNKIKEF